MKQIHKRIDYYSGLDLGQQQQHTAIAVLEKTTVEDNDDRDVAAQYAVRHLERFPIGTSYPAVCTRLVKLFAEEPLCGSTLVIDQTGVGNAVVDMVRRSDPNVELRRVTITTGLKPSIDEGVWLVPKKDLVGVLQILLQTRRLKVAESLPEAATLVQELENFQMKTVPIGPDEVLSWREGAHDDLVLAVAIAAWQAERFRELLVGVVPFVVSGGPAWRRWP